MSNLPTPNHQNAQQTPPTKRSVVFLRWLGFLGLMCAFFFVGFYLIGPGMHRASAPTASSAKVDLGGQDEWGRAPAPVARPKDRRPSVKVEVDEISPEEKPAETTATASVPVGENDITIRPSPAPESTQPAPQPAPTPVVKKFYVQIGVYADKTNAEIVSANLADHGYSSSLRQVTKNGEIYYQVAVGSPRERAAADALAAELRNAGREAVVIAE